MDPEKLRQELLTSLRAAIAPLERRMGQEREIAALVLRLKQLLNTLETRPDAIEVLLQMHSVPKQTLRAAMNRMEDWQAKMRALLSTMPIAEARALESGLLGQLGSSGQILAMIDVAPGEMIEVPILLLTLAGVEIAEEPSSN